MPAHDANTNDETYVAEGGRIQSRAVVLKQQNALLYKKPDSHTNGYVEQGERAGFPQW
jgi:hypothetical protein